ncbi:hypothetical protein [Actinomadura sp. DC4]|uniref:hypothetical protein n=1 Tax=Actinomadura sp. DC4 TaxID=3055069 RepID=UPI0025AFA12C|nr:hypothetical protein [Actinomadura sp. DC4]MDN3355660.1 hypothetical protein [Actinomadura sp. DC4]
MSDQGDAGQWRPATSQNDQYSTPDETTGPLPAISGDEADAPGFPSVSEPRKSWATDDDDDAPTGGFPAVSPGSESGSYDDSPGERSVFDPVDRSAAAPFGSPESPSSEDDGDPGPNGTTPRFGTDVPDEDPQPAESSWSGSFGSSPSSFGESSSSFGESSYRPEESAESSFGSFRDSSFPASDFDDKPYEDHSWEDKPYEAKPYEAPGASYGSGGYSPESPAEPVSSATGGFPAPEKGVTAEAQAEENEFFASDDHPPMWDKVVAPAGPPPKPGKPSSGNLRLPEWMRDENAAAAAGPGGPPGGSGGTLYEEEGRSKRPLFLGVGILLVGLVAVAGVYFLKGNGDDPAAKTSSPASSKHSPSSSTTHPAQPQTPVKALPKFKGVHTKAAGRINDVRSGLSYARLNQPWALPPKKSPMLELGFSASQFAVTEKTGAEPKHWARLMSTQLSGAAQEAYEGPGTERAAASEVARMYEERMFNFRTKKRALASQPLAIAGHKGWLVSDYVTYRRPGLKATGDVVAVALVDTGKNTPGVLFMSVPNTSRKLWPDINFVVRSLRVG